MNGFIFVSLGKSGSYFLWRTLVKYSGSAACDRYHWQNFPSNLKNPGFRFEIPWKQYFDEKKILRVFGSCETNHPDIKKILSLRTPYNAIASLYRTHKDFSAVKIFKENWKACAKLFLLSNKNYYTISYDEFIISDEYKSKILKEIFDYNGPIQKNDIPSRWGELSSLERWKFSENNNEFQAVVLDDKELAGICKKLYNEEIMKYLPCITS